jgi:predicted aspartyl protease
VYLSATIGQRTEACLVDTGCQLSLLPERLASPYSRQIDHQRLLAANGTPIGVFGRVTLSIKLNGYPYTISFLVTSDVDEIMLGMDFLSTQATSWDFAASKLIVNGRVLKLQPRPGKLHCRRVVVAEDTVIPPFTEQLLPARAPVRNFTSCIADSLLECRQLQPGFMVARVIVPSCQTRGTACVLNTTPEYHTLRQGAPLGVLNNSSSSCVKIIGKMDNEVTSVKSNEGMSHDRSTDDEKRKVIDEILSKLSEELQADDVNKIAVLLWEFRHILSVNDFDIGHTDVVSHLIDTGNHPPIREALRRHPQAYTEEIDASVKKMLNQGVIEPCSSPWASNVVLVKKKDGTIRCAIDYRKLNDITKKYTYPLPRIDSCLDALQGSTWFSTLDLRSDYWQVKQDPTDADKTAFITGRGYFRFRVLSFGLTGAPSLFQRLMDVVLSGLTWTSALVYLDVIVVFSTSFDDHLSRLRAVFERLQIVNLKIKPTKCQLFQRKVKFLGYVVSADGLETDSEKVKAVAEWPTPRSVTEVRAFVGLCSYYRKFIASFAEIATPLHDLTKKNARFVWETKHETAFRELKSRLISAPILTLPNDSDTYILDTDASDQPWELCCLRSRKAMSE